MAVACAAAELLGRRALDLDLVFLIEGEEEAGSGGFEETVRRHKVTSFTRTATYIVDTFSSGCHRCHRRYSC